MTVTEDKLRELLQEADAAAGRPAVKSVRVATIRRRLRRRHTLLAASPFAAAAVLLLVVLALVMNSREPAEQPRIASLQEQVEQLRVRTDTAIQLVREVLEQERRRQELAALEARLAAIGAPLERANSQIDTTASVLVRRADRLYRELNQPDAAVVDYRRVIELFPQSPWAEVAQQRLSKIEKQRFNKSSPEGEHPWKRQDTSSSC